MRSVFFFFYNCLIVPLFWVGVTIAGFFNQKIKRGIEGRRELFLTLAAATASLTSPKRIWIHVSSMGEFEQAKPLIRALREKDPSCHIIVSFFSPSGYEHSKLFKLADVITYLPLDTTSNARRFLDLVRPTVAIFIRYDIWPNHLRELRKRGIPVVLANATLSLHSRRLLPLIKQFHHYLFDMLTAILTVSENDSLAFRKLKLSSPKIESIGDTRYDQVWYRSAEAKQKHFFAQHIIHEKRIVVAGSTWPEDEAVLVPTIKKLLHFKSNVLFVVVPHEPTLEVLDTLERCFENGVKTIRFSDLNDYDNEPIILVDSVGILMGLYKYASVAYVGGSFKQGVHNVLEPAVYGIPVLCGPRHTNSQEAMLLAERGGIFVVHDTVECYRTLNLLLEHDDMRTGAGNIALTMVQNHIGATEKLYHHLQPYLH